MLNGNLSTVCRESVCVWGGVVSVHCWWIIFHLGWERWGFYFCVIFFKPIYMTRLSRNTFECTRVIHCDIYYLRVYFTWLYQDITFKAHDQCWAHFSACLFRWQSSQGEWRKADRFFSLLKTLKTAQNKIDQFHHITSARWRKVFSEKYQYKRESAVRSER